MPAIAIEPSRSAWDAFVAEHDSGSALQAWAWGNLKGAFGWQPVRVAIADADQPWQIRAAAQILLRRRYGVAAAYAPRGPLLSGDPAIDQALFAQIGQAARAARAIFVRMEPNCPSRAPHAGNLHSDLLLRGYRPVDPIQPRSTILLALEAEPERLLAAMSKGHRADIKRAARMGVVVRMGQGEQDLTTFYQILEQTSRRNQFGIHTLSYYRAVLAQFGESAALWLAERDRQAEATAITLGWGSTALYLYSGSLASGLESGAQHAIQWATIQWARARGCQQYDFWGIPDAFGQAAEEADPSTRAQQEDLAKTDPLFGVYRFKKGFGGQVVRFLPGYDRVLIRPLYALWRRSLGA
jgi:lipid II:glycine glycyltransferase (peptidoglycan interpeptide bridge formation enzyme)